MKLVKSNFFVMDQMCSICKKQTKDIHVHHIVPKSRGGSDKKENLINVCLDCHSKIHDVSFKGEKGLIKEGHKKAKIKGKIDHKWFDENFNLWENLIMNLYDESPEKAIFITGLLNNGFITSTDCKSLIKTGEAKIRINITVKIEDIK